jgi:hypothetical protein
VEVSREREAIAAVVSRPGENDDAPGSEGGEHLVRAATEAKGRVLHQHDRRDAVAFDREAVEPADGVAGEHPRARVELSTGFCAAIPPGHVPESSPTLR